MIPGVNPKQLGKMMKQMGVQQEEISAKEVIIRTENGDIIIKNPSVQKVNMMGQVSYQVSGEETKASASINEDDIQTVMSAANVSREFAEAALEDANGDLAKAILLLKEQ